MSEQREVTFDDGRKPRGHRDRLFVGNGEQVHEFTGASIPGVCAVLGCCHTRNGKWSKSVYKIRLAAGAWTLVSGQDWNTGERFHGCSSVAQIVTQFREAGCKAPDEAIIACLDVALPATMARVRKVESDLAVL